MTNQCRKAVSPINVANPWDDQKQMVLVKGDWLIRLKILAAPLALPSDFLIGLLLVEMAKNDCRW